jgi:hypothetical protein
VKTVKRLELAVVIAIAGVAWFAFAEHPTARNFRTAVQDTLPLL